MLSGKDIETDMEERGIGALLDGFGIVAVVKVATEGLDCSRFCVRQVDVVTC